MNELREEYCKENGINWIKPENTRASDYVIWLEKRILALTIPVVSVPLVCDVKKGEHCKDSFPSYKDGVCYTCGGKAN